MQTPQRSFLRPLTAAELIGQTFVAFRRLFGQLALIPLLLLAPVYIAAAIAAFDPWLPILRRIHEVTRDGKATLLYVGAEPSLVAWIVLGAVVVAYAVMQVVMSAAVVTVVGQGYVGAPARWQLGVRLALRRCGSILWTTLLLVVVMLGGVVVVFFVSALLAAAHVGGLAVLPVLAGLIGAVWLGVSECVLIAVIVCEQLRGMAALKRSFALVKGRWGATLGVLLVIAVVTQVAASVLQTLGGAVLPGSATFVIIGLLIGGIASLLLVPLVPVATACLYFDLKNRHEGLDLGDVAHRLGVSVGGSGEARGPPHAAPLGDIRGSHGGGAAWPPPPTPYPPSPAPSWPGPPGPPDSAPGWPPPPSIPPPSIPPPSYPPPSWPPFQSQPRSPSSVWGDVVPPPLSPAQAPPPLVAPEAPSPAEEPAPPGATEPPVTAPPSSTPPAPETVAEALPPRPAVWPAPSPKPPAPRASWTTENSSSGVAGGSGDTTPGDAAEGHAETD